MDPIHDEFSEISFPSGCDLDRFINSFHVLLDDDWFSYQIYFNTLFCQVERWINNFEINFHLICFEDIIFNWKWPKPENKSEFKLQFILKYIWNKQIRRN